MKRILILFELVGLLLTVAGLFGCGGKSVEPFANTTRYDHGNKVAVGAFVYSAVNTRGVRENEIENTGSKYSPIWGYAGSIVLNDSIADFVRATTATELANTGLKLNDKADIIIYGDVKQFQCDVGWTYDLTYVINYTIFQKSIKKTLFSRQYVSPMTSMSRRSLQVGFVQTCRNIVSQACAMFITDPEVKAILDKASANGVSSGQHPLNLTAPM